MLLINFGGLTPPVGVIMFTVCGILNVETASERAHRSLFAAIGVFFVLLAAFPWLSLTLPNAIMR